MVLAQESPEPSVGSPVFHSTPHFHCQFSHKFIFAFPLPVPHFSFHMGPTALELGSSSCHPHQLILSR